MRGRAKTFAAEILRSLLLRRSRPQKIRPLNGVPQTHLAGSMQRTRTSPWRGVPAFPTHETLNPARPRPQSTPIIAPRRKGKGIPTMRAPAGVISAVCDQTSKNLPWRSIPHTRTGRLIGIPCSPYVICHPAKGCRRFQNITDHLMVCMFSAASLTSPRKIAVGNGRSPARSKLLIQVLKNPSACLHISASATLLPY